MSRYLFQGEFKLSEENVSLKNKKREARNAFKFDTINTQFVVVFIYKITPAKYAFFCLSLFSDQLCSKQCFSFFRSLENGKVFGMTDGWTY